MTNKKRLRDILINELSFEVIKDDGYNKKRFESYTIILKVTNHSVSDINFKLRIRYTSILFGLMVDDFISSENATSLMNSTFIIEQGSFGILRVRFNEITEVRDGDRMEFEINGKTKLLLIRNKGEWFVLDKQTKALDFLNYQELESKIEHFETIEDRMGITIQNFSLRYSNDRTLYIDFEIIATNTNYYKKAFCIYTIIYDRDNNIVSMVHDFTGNDGFKGYGKFSGVFHNFDLPISEIGLIRIYPV